MTPGAVRPSAPAIPARDRRSSLLEDSAPNRRPGGAQAMSNGAQAFAQVFGDRVRAYPGAKDEETITAMSPARLSGSSRLATYFHVHLVSDSTGETLNAMAKAVIDRFDGVIPIEHIYALVRSEKQMDRVLQEVEAVMSVQKILR